MLAGAAVIAAAGCTRYGRDRLGEHDNASLNGHHRGMTGSSLQYPGCGAAGSDLDPMYR
jgi:hypothetical protein